MFELPELDTANKPLFYDELALQAKGLLMDEPDGIANAANFTSLLYHAMPDVNWVGFYFLRGDELVVGPFQGKPACVRIAMGSGVCGSAAKERKTLRVGDVDAFPGHIPCDSASKSEIVVPLVKGDEVVGVLDIDSPIGHRFDEDDEAGVEKLAKVFIDTLS
ncbi:MAG: GAF domain-containing protein [Gammaproteobacteria bacterium]|nr:GAF domain-containing protein [Gammaproteobacteria bacterium]